MRFRACKYTPKSCECPLPEKHDMQDEIECTCCKHISQYIPDRWSRSYYCNNGTDCIMGHFPAKLHYQWEMTNRCLTAVGMGVPDISIEKFKFFISDIMEIERDKWQEIYDMMLHLLAASLQHKEGTTHIEATDIEKIRELSKR